MMKKKVLVLVLITLSLTALCLTVLLSACAKDKISFALDKSELNLTVGGTAVLTVQTDAEDAAVHWGSSDEAVVTVTDFGGVSAVAAGNAVITATAVINDKTYTANCNVTVIDSYIEKFDEEELHPGDTLDLSLAGNSSITDFAYTITVTKDGSDVTDSVLMERSFSAAEPGEYIVTYNVTGTGIADSRFSRTVVVREPQAYGLVSAVESTSSVNVWAATVKEMAQAPAGEPNGKTEVLALHYSDTEQHLRVTFPENILNYSDVWNDNDYFELTYYIDSPVAEFAYEYFGYIDIMSKNDDSGNGPIVKRFEGNFYTANQWSTLRLYVKDFEMFTDDFNALYIRFHMGNETVNNQYIDALYISQLCFVPGDVVTQPNTSFDAGIPNVSAYTWVAKNASGEQKASGNQSNTAVTGLSAGQYTIEYTFADNSIADKTFSRDVLVQSAELFDIRAESVTTYHKGYSKLRPLTTAETIESTDPNHGVVALKVSANADVWDFEGMSGTMSPRDAARTLIKFHDIDLRAIAENAANADKYLKFVIRYENNYLTEGATSAENSFYFVDAADAGTNLGTAYALPLGTIQCGKTTTVYVPVSVIRAQVEEILAAKTGMAALGRINPLLDIQVLDDDPRYTVTVLCAGLTDGEAFVNTDLSELTAYQDEKIDLSVAREEPQFTAEIVSVTKENADVTQTVLNGTEFCASESGEYTVTYKFSAYGYKITTVQRTVTVSDLKAYFKEFDDPVQYVGQTVDLVIEEPDIENFTYTITVKRDGKDVTESVLSEEIITFDEKGAYVVTYAVTADGYEPSEVERVFEVREPTPFGMIYDLSSVTQQGSWANNGTQIMTADYPKEGAPGDKGEVLKIGYAANARIMFAKEWGQEYYDLSSELAVLDDSDYFSLRYYIASSSNANIVYRRYCYVDLVSQADGGNNYIIKRWSGVMLAVNEWAELRILVRDIRPYASEDTPMYLRVHFGNETPAPDAIYFYDFHLVLGEKYVKPDTEFSVALPNAYTPLNEYNYTIKNISSGAIVKTGTKADTTVKDGLAAGTYTVEYTHSDVTIGSPIVRTIVVADSAPVAGIADEGYLVAMSRGQKQYVRTVLKTTYVKDDLPSTNKPEALTEAIRIEGDKTLNETEYPIVFKYNIDLKAVLEDPANVNKYLRFYVYYDQSDYQGTSGTKWNEFYLHEGLDDLLGSSATFVSLGDTSSNTNLILPNQWCEVKIAIADILKKSESKMVEGKFDAAAVTFGGMIHYIDSSNFDFDVWLSALEIVD